MFAILYLVWQLVHSLILLTPFQSCTVCDLLSKENFLISCVSQYLFCISINLIQTSLLVEGKSWISLKTFALLYQKFYF